MAVWQPQHSRTPMAHASHLPVHCCVGRDAEHTQNVSRQFEHLTMAWMLISLICGTHTKINEINATIYSWKTMILIRLGMLKYWSPGISSLN